MATQKTKSVVGVYENLDAAQKGLDDLRRAGFPQDEIGIVGNVGETKATMAAPSEARPPEENVVNSLIFGGFLGAVVGGLVMIIIPGTGLVSGAGPAFEVLGGLILGAAAGGIIAAFAGLVFAHTRARRIAQELQRGHVVVAVNSASRAQEAEAVMRRHGSAPAQ